MTVDAIQSFLSALVGTLVTSFLAKLYVTKSLKDLEAALSMCHEINRKLAVICEKVSSLERVEFMVREHDRKIISLETSKKYGKRIDA